MNTANKMTEQHYILFCKDPFERNKVDQDFEDEFISARENGFETLLFSFEDLTSTDRFSISTEGIRRNKKLVNIIYRGWMLTPQQYSILYNELLSKNFRLINSVKEYQNCHYLPDSLKFIENSTAKTVFEKFDNKNSIDKLIEKSKVFGQKPVILKDYVKSEKHNWETACYVADASDADKLKKSILTLVELRDKYLNEGIVVREFIELNSLTLHSKSGMPLTEEYRLFFCNNKLIGSYDYWEEGEYKLERPDTVEFEKIAKQIKSNFFSMDIARQKNGKFIIIELGDGQVAGLPDKTNIKEFYRQLKILCS
ncbi:MULTISPECIES: ATP-grasp domain-containing protein [unclassified Sphingobacterium]|uniref:ATP-grasp domain-containing protein n=1 Tax=unclassified Sphingobacterium TaxID=2609468 RepID=UPI002600DF65|nr:MULTISPECIES: ATP-grasp domain-containing protein [unclassified Sphingobacterium]